MQNTTKLGALLLTSFLFASSAFAGTLTNLTVTSNGGTFINDTIENFTSPIGFTLLGSTTNPFLNAANSNISLGYGSYYAITSGGFGQHLGAGSFAFRLDDTDNFSQNVNFPDNVTPGQIIATFNLPGGDIVQLSTTGIFADRVAILVNGAGLTAGGSADPFWLLTYTSANANGSPIPEPSSIALGVCGLAAIAWHRRQK